LLGMWRDKGRTAVGCRPRKTVAARARIFWLYRCFCSCDQHLHGRKTELSNCCNIEQWGAPFWCIRRKITKKSKGMASTMKKRAVLQNGAGGVLHYGAGRNRRQRMAATVYRLEPVFAEGSDQESAGVHWHQEGAIDGCLIVSVPETTSLASCQRLHDELASKFGDVCVISHNMTLLKAIQLRPGDAARVIGELERRAAPEPVAEPVAEPVVEPVPCAADGERP